MRVDPAKCHDSVLDLCFKKVNLSIVRHSTCVMLANLLRHDERRNNEIATLLYACEYAASFDVFRCVEV